MQQLFFVLILLATIVAAYIQYSRIKANIGIGQAWTSEAPQKVRWKNTLLVALGQQKMFSRMLPAVFHLFIYIAFLITQVELIEILIDGLGGDHRFFAPRLGIFYTFVINFIEIISLLAFVATIVFLWRRNVARVKRFQSPEMKGWPFRDANLILIAEILLIVGIFTMNGADVLLQSMDPAHYPDTGRLLISSQLGPALFGGLDQSVLVGLERFGWWLHIVVVFGFINYLPQSKHLHLFFAFINAWFAPAKPRGLMLNMPEIEKEVKVMLGLSEEVQDDTAMEDLPEFGAKDIFGLSWKTLLDAYTCTECGRCTSECPANLTGKKLSPRKVMMDIRDRVEEVAKNIRSGDEQYIEESRRGEGIKLSAENYEDEKSLFSYITREELHACTTCNACVEACPVLINPLEPILQLRRYEILTESKGPQDWMPMFTSMENSGSPWQIAAERDAWTNLLSQ